MSAFLYHFPFIDHKYLICITNCAQSEIRKRNKKLNERRLVKKLESYHGKLYGIGNGDFEFIVSLLLSSYDQLSLSLQLLTTNCHSIYNFLRPIVTVFITSYDQLSQYL